MIASPKESNTLCNNMVQAKAAGEVKDLWDMRKVIANSLNLKRFSPTDKEIWDAAYVQYLAITKAKR